MLRYDGASFVVLGIMLTACGLDSSEPIPFRLARLFPEWAADGPGCLLIGGTLSVMLGLSLAAHCRRRA
jgi:hypothetical protein